MKIAPVIGWRQDCLPQVLARARGVEGGMVDIIACGFV